jgi:hypothetical protein
MQLTLRRIVSLLLLTALSSTPLLAGSFQGRVVMENREGKKASQITYLMKDGALRMETSAENSKEGDTPGAMILLPKESKMIVLMPEQRMYMIQAFDPAKAAAKVADSAKLEEPVKTGRTEKICGYECAEYVVKGAKETTEMWVAEGLGFFVMPMGPKGPAPAKGWEKTLREKGGFPLRTIVRDAKGKERSRMQVISVEEESLDKELFLPPKGWQEFSLGNPGALFGR